MEQLIVKFTLTSFAIASSLLFSGCSTLKPVKSEATLTQTEALENQAASEEWNTPAILTEGKSSIVLMVPESIPDNVRNKKISLELDPNASISDLVAVMGKLGQPIIIADVIAAEKKFYLPKFNGSLSNLLSAITRATDVWFTWHDGTIIVSSVERIGLTVPQEANFADQLTKGLDAFGIKEKSVSWQAGLASIEVSPSQFRRIRSFLERLTNNAAIVTLQVAVVNVTLKQDAKQGIDWEKLSVSVLNGGNIQNLADWRNGTTSANTSPTTTTPTTGTTTTTTPTTGTTTTPVADTAKSLKDLASIAALSFSGGALQGAVFTQRFSFSGLFNYLQTYGVTETKQNMVLKTAAGNKVEFKSLTQTPYVSEIGVTTTGSGTGSATQGSTKTEKADDGITLEMTPLFDAASESVTIDMKLSLKAVVGFNELSAGNQIGKLTQPTTADRSFTDSIRVKPGQTVVVGGLSYDAISNNKGAPPALVGTKLESQSLKVDRQTMFIILRPTIQKLGQVLKEETGGLDLSIPKGANMPEPIIDEVVLKKGK